MANNWSMLASYRWSRLRGNFEGFYENLTANPILESRRCSISRTNDPTYSALGAAPVPGISATLAMRMASSRSTGRTGLNLNRQLPVPGLNIGVGVNIASGMPLTPLADNGRMARPAKFRRAARLRHPDR